MPPALHSLTDVLRDWLPSLVTLLIGVLVIGVVHRLMLRRHAPTSGSRMLQQLLLAALGAILVILVILALPIGDSARGQLLSLLGILVAAAIALSSTTLLGNAMAGLMLRSIQSFKPGDFIIVEGIRGRVSELALLRTEIQTERRDLTTLPNLYLVTNPVTVVRSSGTFISATVSLGYDVPREKVERCLLDAATKTGLTDPYVFILALGDFSITYQAAGFLEQVKYLISAESSLREQMLDALHGAGIEIVSPTFMNQRLIPPHHVFIPKRATTRAAAAADETHPEERMFDKAELAERKGRMESELRETAAELAELKINEADPEAVRARVAVLEARLAELEAALALQDGPPPHE